MADVDFLEKNTEGRNRQIYTRVIPEGIHILIGNDVISYFRSAADRVHATAAVTDYTVTNDIFWKIMETSGMA